jgi:threonine/homoserine/homoserine lactone efflux protein
MTAAAVAAGTRGRHAGAVIALGHAVIEFPLMLVIITGVGRLLELQSVKIGIGLAGGTVLLIMGVQLLLAAGQAQAKSAEPSRKHPLAVGILLTAGNPYFLIWWATVGLALATQAIKFGVMAFALFAVVHWLCDLVWLEALSMASFKGSELLGGRIEQTVLVVCGVMLVGFGVWFLYDAGSTWLAAPQPFTDSAPPW